MQFAPCIAAVAFLIIGVCLASPPASLINGWMGKATAHFAIFTTERNDNGRDLIQRLETARRYFEQTGWAKKELNAPLNILAFGPGNEFDQYRINAGAFAFYQRTREGDFVVMRSLEPEHYTVAVHEFTHFIVQHSGLKLPIWLNEGLADFYSTIESRKGQAVVGTPPPGREDCLDSRGWIDWSTLATVDQHSVYYRQPDKMLMFYAQSWALVHVLAMDPAYADKFQDFLKAISNNATLENALATIYHKKLDEIGREVEQTAKAHHFNSKVVDIDVRPGALQMVDVADAPKQAEFALADVLAANPRTLEEAKVRLQVLSAKYPDDPRTEESLGFLAMRGGLSSEAKLHFAKAVGAHSKDPEVLFGLAHLKLAEGGSSDEAIDLLQQAVTSDGANYNALIELGFAAARSKRYELAAETLGKIKEVNAEHAYAVRYTLAYCFSELHQNNQARIYAEEARKVAGNVGDQQQVAQLMRYINQEAQVEIASRE